MKEVVIGVISSLLAAALAWVASTIRAAARTRAELLASIDECPVGEGYRSGTSLRLPGQPTQLITLPRGRSAIELSGDNLERKAGSAVYVQLGKGTVRLVPHFISFTTMPPFCS
jgi:hypothetical protein